jgi:hypothetical protein
VAKPVTDSALLAALEAADSPAVAKPVTDPKLLAQLEGGEAKAAPAIEEKGTLQQIREAIHAPTRILENGVLLGLGDRARAVMGTMIGEGRPSLSGLVTGEPSGYGGLLKKEQAETEQFQKDHPIAAPALDIVGSSLAPVGAGIAAAKGASLGAKTLYAALTGGTIGALQGGLSSKDWTDIPQTARDTAIGGGAGFVLGGAIPGAAKVIGSGVNAVANAIRGRADGLSRGATKHLVSAMEADTPAAVRAELDRLGPDAMLADSGPSMLGKTQGAALLSDEGRTVATNALTGRNQGTNSRIMGDVERAMGPAEDPQTVTNAIIAHRSTVDARNYGRAIDAAPAVQTGEIMRDLSDAIPRSVGMEEKALTTLKGMLTRYRKKPRIDPYSGRQEIDNRGQMVFDSVPVAQEDALVLHKIKGELDNVIEYDLPGLGVPAGAVKNQQFALKQFRHQLNQILEQQVPGYAGANRVSAQLARRADAVRTGQHYLGEGETTPSPGRFQDEFEQLEAGERIALGKGSRGYINRKLGTKAKDLPTLQRELQGEGGWNTDKIAIVHGDDAARDLMNSVERNLKFRDTHTKVVENSQTEIRRSAREAMKPTQATDVPLITSSMTIPGIVAAGAKKGVAAIANAMLRTDPTRSYGEVARVLTAQGAQRDRYYQAIADALAKRSQNSVIAERAGDRSTLAAAVVANALLRDRTQRPRQ